jgi:WD40 repeat protein
LQEREGDGPVQRVEWHLTAKVKIRYAGNRVAVAKDDVVRVWNTVDGSELTSIPLGGARGLMLSPDGRRMLLDWTTSNRENKRLALWDVDAARLIRELPCSTSLAPNLFSDDSRLLLTGCWAQSADVWDAADGGHVRELRPVSGHLYDARFDADGRHLATIATDGPLQVWDVESNGSPLTLSSTNRYDTVDIASHGTRVVASAGDGNLVLWDASAAQELLTLEGVKEPGDVPQVRFADADRAILAARRKGTRVWSVAAGPEGAR